MFRFYEQNVYGGTNRKQASNCVDRVWKGDHWWGVEVSHKLFIYLSVPSINKKKRREKKKKGREFCYSKPLLNLKNVERSYSEFVVELFLYSCYSSNLRRARSYGLWTCYLKPKKIFWDCHISDLKLEHVISMEVLLTDWHPLHFKIKVELWFLCPFGYRFEVDLTWRDSIVVYL